MAVFRSSRILASTGGGATSAVAEYQRACRSIDARKHRLQSISDVVMVGLRFRRVQGDLDLKVEISDDRLLVNYKVE